jgi:hypothetical protein
MTPRNILTIAVLLVVLAFPVCAQAPPVAAPGQTNNVVAVGVSVNPGGSPQVAGTGLWARLVNSQGTYAFTVVDALPASIKPFTVTTNVSAGIAQKVLTINGVDILVPTAAGISWTGSNTGWAWSTGGMAAFKYKQTRILPNVRFLKSSVSGAGAGYAVIAGILFGWGW